LKRRFRLTGTTDFKQVRRLGKSYTHPLIVLIVLPNQHEYSRFAVAAGRSVGQAVDRNRAKRWLREMLRPLIPTITPGWDVLLLARQSISKSSFRQCQVTLSRLLERTALLRNSHGE